MIVYWRSRCSIQPRRMKLAMALLTRSREAPTIPASSSWVTGSVNWSLPSASSSRRLAVRPVTSRNTESASASSIARSRWASRRVTFHSSRGCWSNISSTGAYGTASTLDGSSARAIAERGRSSSMPSSPNRSPGSISATTLSRRSIGLAMAIATRPRVTT